MPNISTFIATKAIQESSTETINSVFILLQLTIPALVSILSIFATYWFSSQSSSKEKEYTANEKIYSTFHIPFIKKLSVVSPNLRDFYYMIVIPSINNIEPEFLLAHFTSNIQFAPAATLPLISRYFTLAGNYSFYDLSSEHYNSPEQRDQMIEASNLFDQIVKETLLESSRLAAKLKYPDIAKPILEDFLKQESSTAPNQRYLPLENRKLS